MRYIGVYIMYRQLQQKVREYIIGNLCQISDKWKFDIDSTNVDEPIIVGSGQYGLGIRAPIEKFHWVVTPDLVPTIRTFYRMQTNNRVTTWGGYFVLLHLFNEVFNIYGVNTIYENSSLSTIQILKRNGTEKIKTNVFGVTDYPLGNLHFIAPFFGKQVECIMNEQLVAPLLLLLDPITYFRKYSVIIGKYPELNMGHTLGIYELLLEYFPEMNEELFEKYLVLWYLLQDICVDMIDVVGIMLVELYR